MTIENLIKENPEINITVKTGDLMAFGKAIATYAAHEILERYSEKLNSRTDVIQRFGICSTSLWRWEKMGLIISKKIGNRKFYPESEIKRIMNLEGGSK